MKNFHDIKMAVENIWFRNNNEIVFLKPIKIEINGKFPSVLTKKGWIDRRLRWAIGAKKYYPVEKLKSDNISWMAECEAYKVNI